MIGQGSVFWEVVVGLIGLGAWVRVMAWTAAMLRGGADPDGDSGD